MKVTLCGLLAIVLCILGTDARAECSASKIRDLAKKGRIVASIAERCEMTSSEVRKILKSADDEDEQEEPVDPPDGLPHGATVVPCGCWGYAAVNATFPEPRCESNVSRARMCTGMCPMGGYSWRAVCQ